MEFYKDNLRDFYFDINTVPGPLIETTEELVDFIKNNSKEDYFEIYGTKYQDFKDTYNEFDKGDSCKRVIELVKGLS
jgi:CDP-glycerol glycerophosphotransferase